MRACDPSTWPIGDASGGQPHSRLISVSSLSTSSRRSENPCARRFASSSATRPAGSSYSAALTATRGESGGTGIVSERRVDELAGTPEGVQPRCRCRDRFPRAPARVPLRRRGGWRAQSGRWRRQSTSASAPRAASIEAASAAPAAPWQIETDRQSARLADPLDEYARAAWIEGPGRVVHQRPRGAELRSMAMSAFEEDVAFVRPGRGCERARLRALSRRRESPRQRPRGFRGRSKGRGCERRRCRSRQRCGRSAGRDLARRAVSRPGSAHEAPSRAVSHTAPSERPDPLPGAFDAAPHGRVEAAAAGDLEVREPSTVEDVGELQEA